ncbi:hypothetical protein C7M84_000377 [Penaeus vannamei]|uniref:Ig-like domain-containing protein n=1 Tax=Penaeus vannamei TaxID=6689 RepID=A0A423TWN0_PENVA|nr:hypothetical protein C7M84_000377 [Penaeus vannamei]
MCAVAIRITRVKVPPLLKVGDEGDLDCMWEPEKDEMYSVKWYQEGHEFYRYTPSSRDPIQIFDPPTLDVDRESSWGQRQDRQRDLGGRGSFHCEVSADAPTFHTASDTAHIRIVGEYRSLLLDNFINQQYDRHFTYSIYQLHEPKRNRLQITYTKASASDFVADIPSNLLFICK